jgi:hypothetical protein
VEREQRRLMRWGRRALREPVALSGAIMGAVNAAVVLGLLNLNDHQIGVLNVALGSVLGFFARTLVTPLVRPRSRQGHALVHAIQHAGQHPSSEPVRPAA